MPKGHVAREFTLVVLELGVCLIGLRLLGQGPVSHILNAKGSCNDQHLIQGAPFSGLQDHSAHPWIQGQFGELSTELGQLMPLIHRTKLIQELVTIGDGFGLGWFKKRKALNVSQSQRFHSENHPSQGASKDLGICKWASGVEVLL